MSKGVFCIFKKGIHNKSYLTIKRIIVVISLLFTTVSAFTFIYHKYIDKKQPYFLEKSLGENYLVHINEIPKEEKEAFLFLTKNMSGSSLEIYTNYINKESDDNVIATGKDVLSESQGLLLLYLLNRNEKNVFNISLNWTLENLYTKNGIISWIKRKDGKKDYINAFIDDLRIVRSLLMAYEKWGDKNYLKYSTDISNALLKYNIKDKFPVDFYDINENYSVNYITISYLDLYTMKKLIGVNKEWKEVYSNSLKLSKNSKINHTGLYKFQYDIASKRYDESENISLIQSVYTMVHLAEVGHYDYEGMNWIYNEYMKYDKLYETYSSETFEPISNIESTALYALLARLFYLSGDFEKAKTFLSECEKFQIINKNSPIYGSFGNEANNEVYSFDNLQYLFSSSIINKIKEGGIIE